MQATSSEGVSTFTQNAAIRAVSSSVRPLKPGGGNSVMPPARCAAPTARPWPARSVARSACRVGVCSFPVAPPRFASCPCVVPLHLATFPHGRGRQSVRGQWRIHRPSLHSRRAFRYRSTVRVSGFSRGGFFNGYGTEYFSVRGITNGDHRRMGQAAFG
jgi:hypothetical protein